MMFEDYRRVNSYLGRHGRRDVNSTLRSEDEDIQAEDSDSRRGVWQ